MGVSSRCGCRCECVTTTSTHDRNRNRNRNNNDAPDAVLEGVAMAGLVAILRQLGDLAELAAEVFDDMQHQVMAASARGRRLAVRAKRLLEADLDLLPPPKSTHNSAAAAALTFTTSSSSSSSSGTRSRRMHCGGAGRLGCRAHVHSGGGTPPPMPRLVVQRIRRCRGPPRLSILDKFDAAGEGACLKRYTDPSFFRAHSARLEQGTLRLGANRGPYLLKSMSMETRPKFQTALNTEKLPESAHTDSKSETETETETDASEAPSPGFLSMLRQPKQHRHRHRQAAGAGSLFRIQQAVDRVQSSSSPQLNTEKKLQGGGTAQPSPSPSELERTSSFEAWLSPDARCFTTTTTSSTHHHEHDETCSTQEPSDDGTTVFSGSVSHVVTTSNADAALSNSTMLKANKVKGASNKSRSRYKGSVEMIASRVSSLPRKLFINIKHHNDCSRSEPAGRSSLWINQATGIGNCSPELEAIPTPTEAFLPILVHSDPVYSSMHSLLLPENDKCYSYLQNHESIPSNVSVDAERHHQQEDPSTDQCSNNNSTTPETIADSTCTTPDSKNLLLPGSLVLKPAGVLPENPCPENAKVDTTPPLPPVPPMQWLSERVHTGTPAPSPKHRALWKKSLEVTEMIQVIRQAHSHSIQTSPVDTEETLVSNEHTSADASRDEMKCSESEETMHPQPFRVREDAVQASEGNLLKAGEFPVPAILSDEAWSDIDLRTQAQADTCFQQQGRQQFGSSGHSDDKPSEEHQASDDRSNLQNESVFFSAVQELAKMPPSPSVPRPKYSLLDAGSHGRIMLRNGPSLIHPSRNILDSRSVLIKQIKDIAMAGNPSFKLKPVSGASSPQSPVIGSPTNSKVATILQRADDIRQAHAHRNDVDGEEIWSDDSE